MITIRCTGLWLILTKTFRCGSNKYLYGETGAAALIKTFDIGTGDSMPAGVKSHPYLEETCFLFFLIIAL